MLKKYLETQQDNFDQMRVRHSQLLRQAENEMLRTSMLCEHINNMETNKDMSCSLSLQNLSSLKLILQDMVEQQQHKSDLAKQEALMQQQACNKQAAYNLAIAQVIEQREMQQLLKQQKAEQKQQDELAMQMHLRRQAI